MKKLADIDYYFITDSQLSRKGNVSDVRSAVRAGCRIVQYREKAKDEQEMIQEASALKKLCGGGALFLINDHVNVALTVDADGVHLGQDDMDIKEARKILGKKIIGITVHDVKEAIDAEDSGADYVGLSPVFSTGTKTDAGKPCGIDTVARVRSAVNIPIVALGGVNKKNAPAIIRAGANSVAAISAVLCADDVGMEVTEFIKIVRISKKTI